MATKTSNGLEIQRFFSSEDHHPYDEVTWEKRDILQKNWQTGEVVFEQKGVEFPEFWSTNASNIVASKYFRKRLADGSREYSLKQLIDRIVKTYAKAARDHGYMSKSSAKIFEEELTWLLLNQYFSFNSPVWFNVGTTSSQQISACFILGVEDSMESILNWYREEGLIFKGGSGAGVNLSNIRSSKEQMSSGGIASGPVSFMRGADSSAGAIKSGGTTRRSAKMVVLDVDHPDIEEFVETKAGEERKIRALRDAGFDMEISGKDIVSVQYQNANNSVRVTDDFMRAVQNDENFDLKAVTTGETVETVKAKDLFHKVAQAAWECADPGIQYKDTINSWHTNPATGPITASNPCSEFLSLDNSSCNLASLNLMKFLNSDGSFDVTTFVKAVEIVITAMDVSICFADFPTEKIGQVTRDFRQLGIGYTNLGALLMATGKGYDSVEGRSTAAAITSLMTAVSYRRSAELAAIVGPYNGYTDNLEHHNYVMLKHKGSHEDLQYLDAISSDSDIVEEAAEEWNKVIQYGKTFGFRNSQASLLAPTGTISFMMDSDTTGIEPDFSLVKFKKLSDGGSMKIVNQTVPMALKAMRFSPEEVSEIVDYISEKGHVVGAPHLIEEEYHVFDTAVGVRSIKAMGHVRMMAAVQPFLSGAISKTVNLPETATVEDIADVYMQGWELGLKALAVYRDNCKVGQPLSDKKIEKKDNTAKEESQPEVKTEVVYQAKRSRLPKTRRSLTTSFSVSGAEGYATSSAYEDGSLGEVFLKLGKQGSTLSGVMDAFSIAVSIGLQYGVPLETFVQKFTNLKFEPAGMTDDPDIRIAQSIMDYIFRRLALDYLSFEDRSELGIFTSEERARYLDTGSYAPTDGGSTTSEPEDSIQNSIELMEHSTGTSVDAPLCFSCGTKMRPSGSCYVCEGCGSTSGCS